MDILLKPLNTVEILGYLGHSGQVLDANTLETLRQMEDLLLKTANPKFVFLPFSLMQDTHGLRLLHTETVLSGKDIAMHFSQAKSCILFAATLGATVDATLRKLQASDMAKAVIFDAIATAAIEQVCDIICHMFEEDYKKDQQFLTSRFSPGYGDLPLALQKEFCNLLDTPRKIGLSLTDSFLLTPQKSVTALVGITSEAKNSKTLCAPCAIFDTCTLRKVGKTCGLPK